MQRAVAGFYQDEEGHWIAWEARSAVDVQGLGAEQRKQVRLDWTNAGVQEV